MTAEKKEKWFKRIFVLTFAVDVLAYLIAAIRYEDAGYFFSSILSLIPLVCLYVACLFYVQKSRPNGVIFLAVIFALWELMLFFGLLINTVYDYDYYMYANAGSSYGLPALLAGTILLIICQVNKNQRKNTDKLRRFILFAGIACLYVNATIALFSLIGQFGRMIDSYYYGFGDFVGFVFNNILLSAPGWFIGLGIWLAADLGKETEVPKENVEKPALSEIPETPDPYTTAVRDWTTDPPMEDGEYIIWFKRKDKDMSSRKLVLSEGMWLDAKGEAFGVEKYHPALWLQLPAVSEDTIGEIRKNR